jgi:L-threonylcarbamoyladenylate synthase
VKTVVSTDRVAAVDLLRKGDVVALPTETVYGLAADALNAGAVARIFEAKERPRFDPLIVHLPNRDWLDRIADVPAGDRQLVDTLAERLWPGPFTIVLPKREIIPDIVTAGLNTMAIRVSAHPVFADIAAELNKPVAAPSANRFGRLSPTTAQHVLAELDGRIPLIVDAGPTQHGIESTIVAVQDGRIAVLRRGPITQEQLSHFAELSRQVSTTAISAPGQLPSHYAPATPLCLINNAGAFTQRKDQRVGLLALSDSLSDQKGFAAVRNLTNKGDLREAAANLFRCLRELDALGLDLIVAERISSEGLGAAIMDRLQRAAQKSE